MSKKTRSCPRCGSDIVGKFCGECGAPAIPTCGSCGRDAPPGAKFCQECGAPLAGKKPLSDAPPTAQGGVELSWVLVGGLGIVLAVAGVFLLLDRNERAPAPTEVTSQPAAAPTAPGASDPRRVAETLYNQVMMASENGDTARARELAPDALRAYAALGPQDEDGRYHVGLLHLTAGELDQASAQVSAIESTAPDHLLGILLAHAIALESSDDSAASVATRRFLEVYQDQMATGRDEYAEHRVGIERFAERARTISP